MKISINAGHTKSGAGYGASYKGLHESEITRKVSAALIKELKKRGHTVHDSTVDTARTQAAYLKKVCQLVNASRAELFLSIHCNASSGHTGHGVECWTWKGQKHGTAARICASIADLGYTNRGIKDGSGLYVVKHTKPTAILVELFFLDNYNDRALYAEAGAGRIAESPCAPYRTGKPV